MKKIFSLAILTMIISLNCGCNPALADTPNPAARPSKEQMRQRFEQRLNLTDKQKEQARAIHQKGREQMKPIMEQIAQKRQEIEAVKLSRIAEKAQQERISTLTAEIGELEKKAHEIRKANSQEFEKILTKKQKNELAKMKAEGRARFEKNHPARPPFGTQGFPRPKSLFPQMPSSADLFNK